MWQNSCSVDMEIALCYMYIIVPVPYRYSTGSRGSVPVSAVRSSNQSSTCSTRPSTGTVRTGRNPDSYHLLLHKSFISNLPSFTRDRDASCSQYTLSIFHSFIFWLPCFDYCNQQKDRPICRDCLTKLKSTGMCSILAVVLGSRIVVGSRAVSLSSVEFIRV